MTTDATLQTPGLEKPASPPILWTTRDWAEAIERLPVDGPLPRRTVLVQRERVAHRCDASCCAQVSRPRSPDDLVGGRSSVRLEPRTDDEPTDRPPKLAQHLGRLHRRMLKATFKGKLLPARPRPAGWLDPLPRQDIPFTFGSTREGVWETDV